MGTVPKKSKIWDRSHVMRDRSHLDGTGTDTTELLTRLTLPNLQPLSQQHRDTVFWSERSVCDQRSNLGRPLFSLQNSKLPVLAHPLRRIAHTRRNFPSLFKNTEGIVVGFRKFAWAPNSQKY
jgi:hypothetical protein